MARSFPEIEDFEADIAAALIVLAVILFAMHLCYAVHFHSWTAFQRGGGLLALMGAVIIGVPYLTPKAIETEAGKRLPDTGATYLVPSECIAESEAMRPSARFSVVVERVVAFLFVFSGTLISIYADMIFCYFFVCPN